MLRATKERSTTNRNISSVSESLRRKPLIQTKLTIGKSNDKYEAEADRVADKVVKGSGPGIQKKCAGCEQEEARKKPIIQKQEEEEEVQAKPAQIIMKMEEAQPKLNESIQKKGEEKELQAKLINGIQRKGEEEEEAQPKLMSGIQKMEEEEEPVQAKAESGGKQVASSDVSRKIHKTMGQGNGMDRGTRSFMESRFGADFGSVRIHNDSNSHQLSKKLNAQAFTVGNDIYFNRDKYNPESSSGKHLLAHELTHTIQQKGIRRKIQRNANTCTYGEIRQWAIVSQSDHSSPPGLANAKASIGSVCTDRNCHCVDGSNATARGDQAAWDNIVAATGGNDGSGGGNFMCVGTQDCWFVDKCRPIYQPGEPRPPLQDRENDLTPSGTVTVNGNNLYFYNDPRNGNCPPSSD